MSKAVAVAVLVLTLSVVAAVVGLIYSFVAGQPLAKPSLDLDSVEAKARLDSQIVIDIRGSFSKDEILEFLQIDPPVPVHELNLTVEQTTGFLWYDGLPWTRTRVTINPERSHLFEPETSYTVALKDEVLTFDTITVPRVIDVRVDQDNAYDFNDVPTSSIIVLVFNEEVVWRDELLSVEPVAEVWTANGKSPEGGTELWVLPKTGWDNSTDYTLTIAEGVTDVLGHVGIEPFSVDFTTWARPTVIEVTPEGSHLPPDSKVTVEFERPVDPSAVEQSFRIEPVATGSFDWENDRLLTWTPNELRHSTTYSLSVGGTSINGDLIVPHEWSFATHDPPVVVEIEGSDQSPTLLRAAPSGGTGEYSYRWSTGDTGREIRVDLTYDQSEEFEVTVSSGDQSATARLRVFGPPSPCPAGWEVITEDLCYTEETLLGPVQVFVSRVDLRDSDLQLVAAPAADYLGRPGTVSDSAKARKSLVSINGDFFNMSEGEYFSLGPITSGGTLVYAPETAPVLFALDRDRNAWVGRGKDFGIYVDSSKTGPRRLRTINSQPAGNGLALFNAYWGRQLSLDVSGCYGLFDGADDANIAYRYSCGPIENIPLGTGEFLLLGTGMAADWMKENVGLPLVFNVESPMPGIDFMVGGSHILIEDGEPRPFNADSGGRHPRTAIGADEDGFVYLVVVDGRSSDSAGMSLAELRDYLSRLGLVDAINLDGGGSSTMVLLESVMNTPSGGMERAVATVIEVTEWRGTCRYQLVRC